MQISPAVCVMWERVEKQQLWPRSWPDFYPFFFRNVCEESLKNLSFSWVRYLKKDWRKTAVTAQVQDFTQDISLSRADLGKTQEKPSEDGYAVVMWTCHQQGCNNVADMSMTWGLNNAHLVLCHGIPHVITQQPAGWTTDTRRLILQRSCFHIVYAKFWPCCLNVVADLNYLDQATFF